MRARWLIPALTLGLVLAASPPAQAQGNPVGGRGHLYYLNDAFSGIANRQLSYGDPGDQVFWGDWDGNGTDTPMLRRGNQFLLRNANTSGAPEVVASYGDAADEVLAGDWDGNGTDTLAIRRGNQYFIKNSIRSGYADAVVSYGDADDLVLSGDWDGDGDDTLAVRRGNQYFIKNVIQTGYADSMFAYGNPDDRMHVGDWDADGRDTLGVQRMNAYYLRNETTTGYAHLAFAFGDRTDTSFVGDFDGNGGDTFGIRRLEADVRLMEGGFVAIGSQMFGRSPGDVQALINVLGQPDGVLRRATCGRLALPNRLLVYGDLAVQVFDKEYRDVNSPAVWRAGGISGWVLSADTDGVPGLGFSVPGPMHITVGTPLSTVEQRYDADPSYSTWLETDPRAYSVFAGDTTNATFFLDADDNVSAMTGGWVCP